MSELELSNKFIEDQLISIESKITELQTFDRNDVAQDSKYRLLHTDLEVSIKLFACDMLDCPIHLQPTGELADRIENMMKFEL